MEPTAMNSPASEPNSVGERGEHGDRGLVRFAAPAALLTV